MHGIEQHRLHDRTLLPAGRRSSFKPKVLPTLKRERKRAGEPDESYIFTKGSEEAGLVIEAALTSGGLDKLDFYLGLKMPEVWIWVDGKLSIT